MFSKRAGSFIRILSWISISGISIAMMALVIVASVMNGFNGSLKNRMMRAEPDLVVFGNFNEDQRLEFKNKKDVVSVEAFIQSDVVIKTLEGAFGGGIAKGLSGAAINNFLAEVSSYKNEDLDFNEVSLKPGEVILGYDLAANLGVYEGEQLVLMPPEALLSANIPNYQKVTVARIMATEIPAIDQTYLYYDKSHTLKLLGRSSGVERGVEFNVVDPDRIESFMAALSVDGRKETWKDRHGALLLALKLEKMTMTLFLGLAALITSFSLITLLVLLITQKRKDIALMLVMGSSISEVRSLFIRIGMLLSSLGMLLGIGLGVVVCLILDNVEFQFLPDFYTEKKIPAELNPTLILGLLIFAVVLSVLASWLPVRTTLTRDIVKTI